MTLDDDAPSSGDDEPARSTSAIPSAVPWRKYRYLRGVSLAAVTDAKARELLRDYGKLVATIVRRHPLPRHSHAPIEQDDMLATGNALMLQAYATFDSSRGMKLSSWIGLQVEQSMRNLVREARGITRQQVADRGRGTPIDYEAIPRVPVSLASILSVNGAALGDMIAAEGDLADDAVAAATEQAWLRDAIERWLTPRERSLVLGMLDGDTLERAGEKHGFTREWVRQIIMGAVKKLQTRQRDECAARVLERAMAGRVGSAGGMLGGDVPATAAGVPPGSSPSAGPRGGSGTKRRRTWRVVAPIAAADRGVASAHG